MNAVVQPTRRLLSVDDYRLMAEAGVFAPDERVELIEGGIITMAPIGPEHADIVSLLTESLVLAAHGSARVWVQSSVRISDRSAPRPDLGLLARRAAGYRGSLPAPADVLLLIEVAHSSLAYDRDRKAPLYARRGIAELWIVDVAGEEVKRHREPGGRGYGRIDVLDLTRPVTLPTLGTDVDLSILFPR